MLYILLILMNDILVERPQIGPQELFCSTPATIAVAGGTFYSGKSISLLMEAGRNVDHPKYRGAIFRRTYPQITDAGGLADIASNMYPQLGGMPTENRTLWTFPSGSTIKFNHMQHDTDMVNYRASQFCFLGIDQLEEFPEAAFFYLRARNRPAPGYDRKAYCRCSCNAEPGWLADFIEWYWDHNTGYGLRERSGIIRYFLRHQGRIVWGDKPFHIRVHDRQINATSFTFISSTMDDNVIGMEKDPDYRSNIEAMDEVSAERYGRGNWKITYAGGMFNPKEFKIIKREQLPKTLRKLRYWDFAASEVKEGNDPANTASVLMGENGGDIYIMDCTAFQRDPGYTMDQMEKIAREDTVDTAIRWEEEKGSAGRFNTVSLTKRLIGFDAQSDPVSGQKEERAKPLAAATHNGRVFLVDAPWNNDFLAEAGGFPRPGHKKDRIDAASGALKCLCTEKRVFDKFTLSRCQELEIDWSQSSSMNLMYGAYYQAENSAVYFIAAIWDQLDAKLYIFDARRYDAPIPDKIALESIRIMKLRKIQSVRFVGNDILVKENARSTKRVIKEAFNRYDVEWSVNTPVLYEIYGAIVYANSLFYSDSVIISKDCQEAAAQIAGWTYKDQGKPNDGYEFGRCFCHLISDLKRVLDTDRQRPKKQDYVDVKEPVKVNSKPWELA